MHVPACELGCQSTDTEMYNAGILDRTHRDLAQALADKTDDNTHCDTNIYMEMHIHLQNGHIRINWKCTCMHIYFRHHCFNAKQNPFSRFPSDGQLDDQVGVARGWFFDISHFYFRHHTFQQTRTTLFVKIMFGALFYFRHHFRHSSFVYFRLTSADPPPATFRKHET